MATYLVEVNNKFMVRLEHNGSALGAEHYFLDNFKGVWGALAFDTEMMKTECFIGCMIHDELISVEELTKKLTGYMILDNELEMLANQIAKHEDEIKKLTDEKEELENQYKSKLFEYGTVKKLLNAERP